MLELYRRAAVTRTAKWLDACLAMRQALGINAPLLAPVAGGCHPDERDWSAREAAARDGVSGFALTGLPSRHQDADFV